MLNTGSVALIGTGCASIIIGLWDLHTLALLTFKSPPMVAANVPESRPYFILVQDQTCPEPHICYSYLWNCLNKANFNGRRGMPDCPVVLQSVVGGSLPADDCAVFYSAFRQGGKPARMTPSSNKHTNIVTSFSYPTLGARRAKRRFLYSRITPLHVSRPHR